jgi:hypothetical protein
MYNLTIVLIIYSGILTMCVMSAAIGIIIIGVKRVRNLKKYVNYIDNVTMLLMDKITNVNDGYNVELRKLKANISVMDDIIRDVVGAEKLTDDEIKLFDCVCEDTIKQENNQDEGYKFDEHSQHKLYTLLRGGSL